MELMSSTSIFSLFDANTSSPLDRPMGRVALSLLGHSKSNSILSFWSYPHMFVLNVGG